MRYLHSALQVEPTHRESLLAAAKMHFRLHQYARAQDFAGRLLELEPDNASVRHLLGAIHVAAGRLDGIGETAATLDDDAGSANAGMLALMGMAYLRHGRFEDSETSLQKALELEPGSLAIRTQLAVSKMSNGKGTEAIAVLEAIRAEDPEYIQASVLLVMFHARLENPGRALRVAEAMLEHYPTRALVNNVYGYGLERAGHEAAAERAYLTALNIDRAFHPAAINLARLAVLRDDAATATDYLHGVLELDPAQRHALLGLAAIALKQGDVDEAERLWQLAREGNEDAAAPRLLLAKHYRARRNPNSAASMITEAYRLAPFAPPVQLEYVALMLQTGKHQAALKVARVLSARFPQSLRVLELLAGAYNQLGDADGLMTTLQRVAEIAPNATSARVLLARLAIRRNQLDDAGAIAQSLISVPGSAAAGYELFGDLHRHRRAPEEALAAYRSAHELAPTTANLLKLDRLEQDLGDDEGRLAAWLERHPEDLEARLVHAAHLQAQGASSGAIEQYEQMLQAQADNPVLLNNLAWLYHENADERALDLARRAHELAPELAEILDTYGWILVARGHVEQGLQVLTEAWRKAPNNGDITFHLASALSRAGDEGTAREHLQKLFDADATFPSRGDAQALLEQLGE